jgi:polyhydroxyalkanoate synthesis regulator phasin
MDDKIDRLTRTVDELKRQLTTMQAKQDQYDKLMDQIAKDIGANDQKNIAEIIYRLEGHVMRDNTDMQTVTREVVETRRTVASIELMLKEVMKGLSVIYNSVDELEENVLPERQTK